MHPISSIYRVPGLLASRFALLLAMILCLMSLTACGYNQMQRQEEAVFRAFGDLQAALQRRADLVPNLVETVRGFARQEREVLTQVIEARAKATQTQINPGDLADPKAVQNFAQAQGELSSALSRLLVVVEQYPQLTSNQAFRDLMHQLEGTENRINVARQRYNEIVETFNASIRTFPNSLTNSLLLHLERKEFFRAAPGAEQAPQVKF
ncbi:hypothetical protein PCS_00635 [Desulfocurvibacter africanus PCS]|uniref:LemA family protein n=1 Tax=Desulfocurvibacter africanus PCS TaxID=1262666 RepID=M5Q3T2_DESAF|nr:LemA family protein [Desulfocurvibacter africanus]EMG38993.1 hypothetical protein PCS_00635 [Desulfocurvibacter africanus PCS]